MIVHALSFGLYCLCLIVFYYAFFNYRYKVSHQESPNKEKLFRNWFLTWIVVTYTNFFANICLIWIFFKFRDQEER